MNWLYEVDARTFVESVIRAAMPECKEPAEWLWAFSRALDRFEIHDRDEVAMLLAQVGHESQGLTRIEESLYYSTARITQVWPSRFPTKGRARLFARNPEALANEVYGRRMGNYKPGDGWLFHGRGPIQITGRSNYTRCASVTGLDCVNNPDILLGKEGGALSACWFWSEYVTMGSVEHVTKQINGGLNGISDRSARYERANALV